MTIQLPATERDSGVVGHGARWQFGAYELNEKRAELRRDGELLKIESKPLNLLMLLVRHPGEVITKNDLINALWPGGIASDAMLGGCVARLRTALGEDGGALIRNVFGHGYRFDGQPVLLDQDVQRAPSKVDFGIDDAPPLRPNWRLVRRLGLSGECWLAEHVKTRQRRVFKFSNDPAGMAALKREATIYRLLREALAEQPCYVDLLDWNFDVEPWFIESEYCAGGSLQEWFAAQGGIERVPLATRLDLVIQIAEALAAVHSVGVLHKDLKPANVFVVIGSDGQPTVRLADFGASTLHDSAFLERLEITRAGFTQVLDTGSQAGTLLYLAPEVLAGQPATLRADVYALGLMLYQLIVGALGRPLSTGWESEIDDELLREDIAAATEGNPERRLADAGELARRLRGLVERRAARAAARRAAEAAEQAARRAERARARRAGLIAAFAALAVGFVASAALYVDARKARDLARAQAVRAEQQQARAEAVAEFLGKDMFSGAATDERPVRDLTVRELLEIAMAAVPKRFVNDPLTAASVYESLGRSFIALEYGAEAVAALEAATALHERELGLGAEPTLRLTEQLVGLKWPLGQLPERLAHYQEVLKAGTTALGESHPAVVRLRVSLARGRVQLGLWQEGAEELGRTLGTVEADRAFDEGYRNLVRRALAYVLVDLGRYAEAERLLEQVVASATALRGPRHPDVATARMRLGRVYYETRRFAESRRELEASAEMVKDWSRADGSLPLTARLYLAWLDLQEGRAARAVAELENLKHLVAAQDAGGFDQSYTENRPLALALARLGRRDEAVIRMREALASARATLNNPSLGGIDHPLVTLIARDLAVLQAGAIEISSSPTESRPGLHQPTR